LLSRCKEYITNREEESNPRGIDDNAGAHAANWLERRLRLDLVWEPESDDDAVAACKKCDLLTMQWEALNLLRAEPHPVVGSDVNPHLRAKLPGVLYPQELFEKHFTTVEPHALGNGVAFDFANVRLWCGFGFVHSLTFGPIDSSTITRSRGTKPCFAS
jgi:hypothetical protein